MSYSSYVLYDSTGLIVQSGSCPTEVLSLHETEGLKLAEGVGTAENYYVNLGILTAYSPAQLAAKNSLPSGHIWKLPTCLVVDCRTLAETQSYVWAKVKRLRVDKQNATFSCGGFVYQPNQLTLAREAFSALKCQLSNTPYLVEWTLADNTKIILNTEQMLLVEETLQAILRGIHTTAEQLRSAIQACTTNAQADAITWPA